MFKDLILGAIKPITSIFKARQERKAAEEKAKATIEKIYAEASAKDASVAGDIALVKAKNEQTTWKDEFALVTITAPYWVSFTIALFSSFGIIDVDAGTTIKAMFTPLSQVPDYWQHTFQVAILSALGVTVWNKATK